MHATYILCSERLGRYYVGYTSMAVEDRLRRHNSNHKGFTGRVDDWQLIYTKTFDEKQLAIKLEQQIKSRGARRYLEDLRRR